MPSILPLSDVSRKEKPEDCHSCTPPLLTRTKRVIYVLFSPLSAHYVKACLLLALSLMHVVYLNDFITTFNAFDLLHREVLERNSMTSAPEQLSLLQATMDAIVDYKKNLWMCVGAMCAAVSTASYLLLLPNFGKCNVTSVVVLVVDACSLFTITFLLFARRLIAAHVFLLVPDALRAANSLVNPQDFLNSLKCSIIPRENLPSCADVFLNSIFPVKVLEYLVILCLLTGAYIALAYAIQWCIRHWFPPSSSSSKVATFHTKTPIVGLPSYLNEPLVRQA